MDAIYHPAGMRCDHEGDENDEDEYLCELPGFVRGGLPLLPEASRRKTWGDDDPRAATRPKPRRSRVEGCSPERTYFSRWYRTDGRGHSERPTYAQGLSHAQRGQRRGG